MDFKPNMNHQQLKELNNLQDRMVKILKKLPPQAQETIIEKIYHYLKEDTK